MSPPKCPTAPIELRMHPTTSRFGAWSLDQIRIDELWEAMVAFCARSRFSDDANGGGRQSGRASDRRRIGVGGNSPPG